jgi:hypothetical protein
MESRRLFALGVIARAFFIGLAVVADLLAPDYDNSMMAASAHAQLSAGGGGGAVGARMHVLPAGSSSSSSRAWWLSLGFGGQQQHPRVFAVLDPLFRWDAVHFAHIARHGYTHEHQCAFFPQLPNLLRRVGLVAAPPREREVPPRRQANDDDDDDSAASDGSAAAARRDDSIPGRSDFVVPRPPLVLSEIAFLVLHCACFGAATVVLFHVVAPLAAVAADRGGAGGSARSAAQSASRAALVVWLVSPAAVFFSAAYTETYFALCAFCGMWCMARAHAAAGFEPNSSFSSSHADATSTSAAPSAARALAWLAAATACFFHAATFRSNGLILAGFLVHFGLLRLWIPLPASSSTRRPPQLSPLSKLGLALACVFSCSLLVVPYQAHVTMCFRRFCGSEGAPSALEPASAPSAGASLQHSSLRDPAVCDGGVGAFYASVQRKYWRVGLFSYWTPSNVPNFFIALPTFIFCAAGAVARYAGMLTQRPATTATATSSTSTSDRVDADAGGGAAAAAHDPPRRLLVRVAAALRSVLAWLASLEAAHVVYLVAQLAFAALTMNVQVVVRFVSATPAVYLLYGTLLARPSSLAATALGRALPTLCWAYCVTWAVVGSSLFPNFMPWT